MIFFQSPEGHEAFPPVCHDHPLLLGESHKDQRLLPPPDGRSDRSTGRRPLRPHHSHCHRWPIQQEVGVLEERSSLSWPEEILPYKRGQCQWGRLDGEAAQVQWADSGAGGLESEKIKFTILTDVPPLHHLLSLLTCYCVLTRSISHSLTIKILSCYCYKLSEILNVNIYLFSSFSFLTNIFIIK